MATEDDRGPSPHSQSSRPFDEREEDLERKNRPFDEQQEDQTNEEFYRRVVDRTKRTSSTVSSSKTKRTSSGKTKNKKKQGKMSSKTVQQLGAAEQRPSLQQINQESLRKYKEFEQWQLKKEQEEAMKANDDNVQQPQPVTTIENNSKEEEAPTNPLTSMTSILRISNGGQVPEELEESLSEDIYSLIYTANTFSQPFVFAVLIFVMQFVLLLFILFDEVEVNWNGLGDGFTIPAGVPIRVNVAQAISMVLIAATILGDSGDLTNGLGNLVSGYDPHVLTKNPHASFAKWFTAFAMQTLAGLCMVVVLFFLVMQSTTVISLALNFAALTFIYEIDNLTFDLGRQGFLSEKIRAACERVQEHRVPRKQLVRQYRLRRFLLILMLIGLLIPYGIFVHRQWDAQYLCSKVFVQFNGEAIPDIVYYTGDFRIQKMEGEVFGGIRSRIHGRAHYKDKTGDLRIAYCHEQEAWTISLSSTDHCSYLYKSSATDSFDVTTVAGSTWYAWDFQTRRPLPIDLYMTCSDCDEGLRGNCHRKNGYCSDDNVCVCKDSRLGPFCQQKLPACQSLRVDTRTNELPFLEGVWFSDHYELLYKPGKKVFYQSQHRPVYAALYFDTAVNGTDPSVVASAVDFMFFNGRRWAIVGRDRRDLADQIDSMQRSRGTQQGSDDHNDDDEKLVIDDLLDLFGENDGNGYSLKVLSHTFPLEEILNDLMGFNYTSISLPLYRPFFYSETVDPLSESDKLSPTGLAWFPAQRPSNNILSQWRPDESRPLMTIFLCSECSDARNPCMNAGLCNTDNVCECNDFFAGSMCERTVSCHEAGYCLNNGTCEAWNEFCTCKERYFGSLCQYEREKVEEFLVEA